MLEVDYEIAEAIVGLLADAEAYSVVKDGADAFYDDSGGYVFIPHAVWPYEQNEAWSRFEERVRYVRRFYDDEGRASLDELLGDVEAAGWAGAPSPVRVLKPGEDLRIYRARRTDTVAASRKVLKDPRAELGPPPRDLRMGGRMNAPGIANFYGALSIETCVAEIRPAVGGQVVVGAFEAVRPLKLLDLSVFRSLPPFGSMFRPRFREELARWRFLMGFHDIVSRPIQPHEEFLEYVPTQVVADYLANVLGFDGVIYSSAQAGLPEEGERQDVEENRNIALFNAEGIVETDPAARSDAPAAHPPTAGGPDLDLGLLWQPELPPPPSVRYVPDSAEAYRVASVRYRHEPEFVSLHDDGSPFDPVELVDFD
ncbi:RES family NAD+ phosphorylase [Longimicrobium sp.]|uniref:RES family NAD+ phosphorylase n=1 Tax=Longimicrobium sp. TaxID=2029185 RepID=UPI003B3B4F62